MKKFKFSLDAVLDYRRQIQDSLQVELGTIMAMVRRQEEAVEAARQRYTEINEEYRQKKEAGMSIAEVRGYATALEVQEAVIRREEQALQKLQMQAEAKRNELVHAKQDASSVEKLRERKLADYQEAETKSEEQFIDDLVGARGRSRPDAAL